MYTSVVLLAFIGSFTVVVHGEINGTNGAGTTPTERHQITLAQAQKVIKAAVKKAVEIGQPVNVAVLDFSGYLVAFQRMDNAWPGSIDISIKKAKTAALFYGYSTAALYAPVQPGGSLYGLQETNGGLIVFGGGLPIYVGNILIGTVGVSGGTVDQDVAVVTAAARALS